MYNNKHILTATTHNISIYSLHILYLLLPNHGVIFKVKETFYNFINGVFTELMTEI